MRAVIVPQPGGVDALVVTELPDPEPDAGQVLVEVAATAVNRADILQRRGLYPPPPGASEVLGLEVAGRVAATRPDVEGWVVGDEVCAVVAGGGYAELALVAAETLMPLPPGVGLPDAGGIPEVYATAYDNVVLRGLLGRGDRILVHGGSSGVGTAATLIAKDAGAEVIVTAGSAAKLEACAALGADHGIDYRREPDFDEHVLELTGRRGVDVVLDIIGADYLERNLRCLAPDGRLVVIGLMGGAKIELNLANLVRRRLAVTGSTLRNRSLAEKAQLARALVRDVWPRFESGTLRPVIHERFALEDVAEAHALVERSEHVGKVLLVP